MGSLESVSFTSAGTPTNNIFEKFVNKIQIRPSGGAAGLKRRSMKGSQTKRGRVMPTSHYEYF